MESLPVENQRVKKIIDFTTNGNVLQFSKEIGISQPRINRLFSIDTRSGKYPLVSFEIVQAIINKFVNINAEWLLTGQGEMLKNAPVPEPAPQESYAGADELVTLLRDKIALLEKNNASLEYTISIQEKITTSQEREIQRQQEKITSKDQEIQRLKEKITQLKKEAKSHVFSPALVR